MPVYLTDTLESPNADAPACGIFSKSLTDEHRRAIRIKREVQVLVCMGNPPYDREQAKTRPIRLDDAGQGVRSTSRRMESHRGS